MEDITFILVEILVFAFFVAMVLAAGATVGERVIHNVIHRWQTRHIRRAQRNLADDILFGRGAFGVIHKTPWDGSYSTKVPVKGTIGSAKKQVDTISKKRNK